MSPFMGFLISLGLIVTSLVTLVLVNKKERRLEARQAWLRSLVRRCEELETIAQDTESLLHNQEVLALISTEIVDIYQQVYQEDGQAKHLEMRLNRAKHNQKQYQQGQIQRKLCRIKESDVGISKAIELLDQVQEILAEANHKERVDQAATDRMMLEIEYTRMSVEILSTVAQGHRYYSDDDFINANAHYYHAQKLAGQAKLNDPRRQQLVDEIGQLLSRERASLSAELMPEIEFNPQPKKEARRVKVYARNPEEPPHQQVN